MDEGSHVANLIWTDEWFFSSDSEQLFNEMTKGELCPIIKFQYTTNVLYDETHGLKVELPEIGYAYRGKQGMWFLNTQTAHRFSELRKSNIYIGAEI